MVLFTLTNFFFFTNVRLATILCEIRFAALLLYSQSIKIKFRLYFTNRTHEYNDGFYKKKMFNLLL